MANIDAPHIDKGSTQDLQTHRGQQVLTVAAMYLGYAMFMVLRTIPSVAGPLMIKDPSLGLDEATLVRILAMGTFGAMVGKFVGGYAADRFGGKMTFTVGLLLAAAGIAAFSASTTVWLFQSMFLLALLAKSFGWPSMAKIIGHWFTPFEYGRVWAVLSTSSRAGTILALFGFGALLAFVPWKAVLVIPVVISVVVALLLGFVLKEQPRNHEGIADERQEDSTKQDVVIDRETLPQALMRFARSRQFWLMNGSLIGLTVLWEFLGIIPLYLTSALSLPPATASMASAAFPFGSLIAVLAGGYVFDKLSRGKTAWVMAFVLGVTACCIAVFLLMPHLDLGTTSKATISIALLVLFGATISPCYYLPMSVFSIEFGGDHSGFLISLLDAVAYGMSFLFYYFGVAPAVAQGGWNLVLSLLLMISVWSALMTFFFMRGESQRLKAQ